MQNFRTKNSSLYDMKATVKHLIKPQLTEQNSLPIKQINISDKDRFGNTVYKGSKGGGSEKSRKVYHYHIKREKRVYGRYHCGFDMYFNKPQCIDKLFLHFGTWYRIISQY